MNPKEEILNMLNLGAIACLNEKKKQYFNNLIKATENAIFDVPSEEEIEAELSAATIEQELGFNACLKLFNYKKQTDGK